MGKNSSYYLRMTMTHQCDIYGQLQSRVDFGNAFYHLVQNFYSPTFYINA